MKKISICILCLVFFVFINGCSSNTDPQFSIKNEKANKVNVKVQTSENNKFSILEIDAGKTTTYQKTSGGNVTVVDVTQNESVSFLAAKNTSYTVILTTGKPPSVQVDK